jgi:hypothetical protein
VVSGWARSECTPIPIPRHALPQTLALTSLEASAEYTPDRSPLPTVHDWCCGRCPLGALAIRTAGSRDVPRSVVEVAVLARAAPRASRMVVGILIQRNYPLGMRITEYITTTATVMAACEVGELADAGWFVAEGRVVIGLERISIKRLNSLNVSRRNGNPGCREMEHEKFVGARERGFWRSDALRMFGAWTSSARHDHQGIATSSFHEYKDLVSPGLDSGISPTL